MKSWRTSFVGVVLIIGAVASVAISVLVNKQLPSTEVLVSAGGTIATGVGLISARDNNKSSEDVGAKE